jgi:hypothetical protein
MSLVELESELSAELPTRNLLRRRRGPSAHARASFGSAANANATQQENFNPQTVVNTGKVFGQGIEIESYNKNDNWNTQTATPINFSTGN